MTVVHPPCTGEKSTGPDRSDLDEWANQLRDDLKGLSASNTQGTDPALVTGEAPPTATTETLDPTVTTPNTTATTAPPDPTVTTPNTRVIPAEATEVSPRFSLKTKLIAAGGTMLAVCVGSMIALSSRGDETTPDTKDTTQSGRIVPGNAGVEDAKPQLSIFAPDGSTWADFRKTAYVKFATNPNLVNPDGSTANFAIALETLQQLLNNRSVVIMTGEDDDARATYGKGTVSDLSGPFGDMKTEVDNNTGSAHLMDIENLSANPNYPLDVTNVLRIRNATTIRVDAPTGKPVVAITADIETLPAGSTTPTRMVYQYFVEWQTFELVETETTQHTAWRIISKQYLPNAPAMGSGANTIPTFDTQ